MWRGGGWGSAGGCTSHLETGLYEDALLGVLIVVYISYRNLEAHDRRSWEDVIQFSIPIFTNIKIRNEIIYIGVSI